MYVRTWCCLVALCYNVLVIFIGGVEQHTIAATIKADVCSSLHYIHIILGHS